MKRAARAVSILSLVLLAGCMTAEERRAADEEKCRSYGFRTRNDPFAECMQRLDLDRRAAARANVALNDWSSPPIYRPVIVYRP